MPVFTQKSLLRSLTAATTGSLMLTWQLPVLAQGMLEEVIVTAQKREQSLQDVPIAVSAYSGAMLQESGVKDVFDLQVNAPSLNVDQNQNATTSTFSIRGIGGGGNNFGIESSVGVYVDGTYRARQNAMISQLVDMDSIEVLRGPQGTLFGASSQAGTVRLITNKPQYNDFDFGFDGSLADTSGGELSNSMEAFVNIPLIDDKLAARVAIYNAKEGGYIDNIRGSKQITTANPSLSTPPAFAATAVNDHLAEDNFNDAIYQGFRVGAKFAINDNWEVLVQQFHQEIESEGVWDYDPALGEMKTMNFSPDRASDELDMTSWTVNGAIGNLDLVYTGAYLDRAVNAIQDYSGYADAGPFIPYYICEYPGYATCGKPDLFVEQFFGVERTTNEFRVSTDPEKRLRAIVGVFTDDLDLVERGDWNYPDSALQGFEPNFPISGSTASNPNARPPGVRFFNDFTRGKKETSFFGEVAFDVTDSVTATIGARAYDIELALNGSSNFAGRGPDGDGGNNIDQILAGASPADFDDTIMKFNVQWQANDDINLYATWSEGYRPGGFNRNGGASLVPGVPPFIPNFYESDEVTNIEFGWKTRLLDGDLQFNGALYNIDWTGLQLVTLDFDISNLSFTSNVGEAEVNGFQLDTIYQPTDQLTLFANVSFNDTELTDVPPSIVGLAPQGSPLGLAPELQYVLRGRYEWELVDGNGVFTQLAYSYTDDTISSINAGALFQQPDYTTVDATIGYRRGPWTATLFLENLTDELATVFTSNEDDIVKITPNRPRTIGVRFSYRFEG